MRFDGDELNTIIIIMLIVILGVAVMNGNSGQVIYSGVDDSNGEAVITDARSDQCSPSGYGENVVWQDYRASNWNIQLMNLTTGEHHVIETGVHSGSLLDSAQVHEQTSPKIYQNTVVWQETTTLNGSLITFLVVYDIQLDTYETVYKNGSHYINPQIWNDRIFFIETSTVGVDYGALHVYDAGTGADSPIFNGSVWNAGFSLADGYCALFDSSNDAYIIDVVSITSTKVAVGGSSWMGFKTSINEDYAVFTAYDSHKSENVIIIYEINAGYANIQYYESNEDFSLWENPYAVYEDCIITSVRVNYGGTSDYVEYLSLLDHDLQVISNIGIMRVNIGNHICVFDDNVLYEYHDNGLDLSIINDIEYVVGE